MQKIIKNLFICFCISHCLGNTQAQNAKSWEPYYKPVYSSSYIQDKNFYLLTLLENIPELKDALVKNTDLQQTFGEQQKKLLALKANTGYPVSTSVNIFKMDEGLLASTNKALEKTFDSNPAFREKISFHLRSSGNYSLFDKMSDKELFLASWQQAIKGINYIIDEYASGIPGRYPKIDSISFDANGRYYRGVIELISRDIADRTASMDLFFQPSLQFAIELLKMNKRNEAERFEPMEALENRKAYDYIRQINWNNYKYSVILIPGHGPQERNLPLNPHGIYRCRLASEKYYQGLAPLIILSGGYVHPHQTEFCEAMEMKKELMTNYGVPERAIIIDPHARHTTTNFRNAARLIYYYGIPADKKAVVTSTIDQIGYIVNENFDKRNEKELGYVPYVLYNKLSDNDVEFTPVITSLHHDPLDPLDP